MTPPPDDNDDAVQVVLDAEEEEEELVYVAGQFLVGNLDNRLDSKKDSDGDDDDDLLGERRGRAVLDIFGLEEGDVTSSSPDVVHKQNWAKRAISDADSLSIETKNQTWWKVLREYVISAAHVSIADGIVGRSLMIDKMESSVVEEAQRHLRAALTHWSCNPSALLALANLMRMKGNMIEAMELYMAAAKCGRAVRKYGIHLLKVVTQDDLFLVDGIVLGLGAQVESLEDENDEEKEEKEEDSRSAKGEEYGQSKVLSTASYMAAVLASVLGKHSVARTALQAYGSDVTRIHPNVWDAAAGNLSSNTTTTRTGTSGSESKTTGAFTPSVFQDAIPPDMARVLRYAFRPDAPYWDQSGYERGVYYSFWSDYNANNPVASNVVEDVILSFMLPRVKQVVDVSELAGFEWWVHTRPQGANLGHQLHFDTDEALLEQDQIVSFPISATVLYLTEEDNHFGATVLLDQTPYCKQNAERAWISVPKPRSFLVFPGDLLHGVLPCAPKVENGRKRKLESSNQPHRLTFMVNFWARNIPEKLRKRRLYGPSGPFPPTTRAHSWTNDLLDNGRYPRALRGFCSQKVSGKESLRCIQPAWERVGSETNANDEPVDLPPSGINQRFFVKNAPTFFYNTLFEK